MQNQIQINKHIQEIEDFKKKHSDSFIYFLEEYEKWLELKQKKTAPENI